MPLRPRRSIRPRKLSGAPLQQPIGRIALIRCLGSSLLRQVGIPLIVNTSSGIGVQDHRNHCSGSRNPRSRWIGITVQDGPEYAVRQTLEHIVLKERRRNRVACLVETLLDMWMGREQPAAPLALSV